MEAMPTDAQPRPPAGGAPRGRERALTMIIAMLVAALVVVPVAMTFLFVYARAPIPAAGGPPTLLFSRVEVTAGGAAFSISAASVAHPPSAFLVNLAVNGTLGTRATLSATVAVTVGAAEYLVRWVDSDGTGSVTAGDWFLVSRPQGFPAVTLFVFFLLWSSGDAVATTSWWTPPAPPVNRPVLTFGAANPIAGNVSFSIASVSQSFPASSYKIALRVGATTGSATAIAAETAFATITVGTTDYRVYWTDLGDEGNLNDGDSFRVTGDGVPLGVGSYTFYLLWSADNAQIQTKSWLA